MHTFPKAYIAAALAGTLVAVVGCERAAPTVTHNVSGAISSVNHEKGIVEIVTDPAILRVSVAPDSTHGLSQGEVVTARLELVQGAEPARAYDAPSEGDRPKVQMDQGHSITGEVTQVDNSTGVFNVRAGDEILTFYFPPATVRDLENGEQVTIRIELG